MNVQYVPEVTEQEVTKHILNNQEKIVKYLDTYKHITSLEAPIKIHVTDIQGQISIMNKTGRFKPITKEWAKRKAGEDKYKIYYYEEDYESVKHLLQPVEKKKKKINKTDSLKGE